MLGTTAVLVGVPGYVDSAVKDATPEPLTPVNESARRPKRERPAAGVATTVNDACTVSEPSEAWTMTVLAAPAARTTCNHGDCAVDGGWAGDVALRRAPDYTAWCGPRTVVVVFSTPVDALTANPVVGERRVY